ncbi:hypothetical protein NAT51_08120 [Flavobacterium amniphilum]|uniref:hypothetical protein n=1 Tax=Flavobacterium amniphilum TaxID=1834035 RepID=UPI00202AAA7D|nr:hypothetical protein [Flavobacterium amniphilum]MCL9805484.1 hypothetical protein [Flavobacterium amniphilum]
MKKFLFFICLALTLSCSKESGIDNETTPKDTPIYLTTWKLVSIKYFYSGIEVSNDCELQNNRIFTKDEPPVPKDTRIKEKTATLTEGKMEGLECQTKSINNIKWWQANDMLDLTYPDKSVYYYRYVTAYENGNEYIKILLYCYKDSSGKPHCLTADEVKEYKYILENKRVLD